jgi:primase-polymerase (primpol)-like protein
MEANPKHDTVAAKGVSLTDAAKDRKLKTHNGDLRNLPAALEPLKAKPRWVLWRWEWRNKKRTKPPLQPSGKYASTDDDSTWHTYDEVINVFDGAFDGIGYVLGDDNIALDIDHCRDADTGEIHP